MELTISPKAHAWFKKEIILNPGQGIRFFGKVYGNTPVHEGFSVGMSVDTPNRPLVHVTVEDFNYFIEEDDQWFFEGYQLVVNYDEKLDEPSYEFIN